MTNTIPYMLSPSVIPKILAKIKEARRPDRFTQDFLETKLGHSGGANRPIIPLLKKMGFLQTDGVPTELYNQFRNQTTSGQAIAAGMRKAYAELFDRNEYVYELAKEKLSALLVEITGLEKADRVLTAMVATFWQFKELSNFESDGVVDHRVEPEAAMPRVEKHSVQIDDQGLTATIPLNQNNFQKQQKVGMNLSYTINLNLPETTNPDVFNAIFKALRENLLGD